MSRISFATSQNSSTNYYYDRPYGFPYTSENPGTQASYAPYMTPAEYGAYISSKFNGFPFPVFEKDIEGNPFENWDKTTRLGGYSYGDPSKKTNIYIPVLGIPEYSYSFTKEQLIKAYWRALGSALVVNDTNNLSGSFKYRQGINLLETSGDQLTLQDLSNPQIKGISIEEWEAENPPFCYDYGFGEYCWNSSGGPSTLEGKEGDLSYTNNGSFYISLSVGTDFANSIGYGTVGIDFSRAILKVGENDYRPYVHCSFCTQQYPSFHSIYKFAATRVGCSGQQNPPSPDWHLYPITELPWRIGADHYSEVGVEDLPNGSLFIYTGEGKTNAEINAEIDSAVISAYQMGAGFYSKVQSSNSFGGSINTSINFTYKADSANVISLPCNSDCYFVGSLGENEKTQNLGTSPCADSDTNSESVPGSAPCTIVCTGGYGDNPFTQQPPEVVENGSSGTVRVAFNDVEYCCDTSEEECCADYPGDWQKINAWYSTTWSDYVTYNSLSDQFFQAYQSSSYGGSYGPYMPQSVFNSCDVAGYARGFGLSASIKKSWSNVRPMLSNGELAPLSPNATTYTYAMTPKVKSKLLVNGPVENCYVKVWVALIKTVENFSNSGYEKTVSIESITPYEINPSPTNNRGCSAVAPDCSTSTSDTDQSNLFGDAGVEFELDPSTFGTADFYNSLTDEAPPGYNYGQGDIAYSTVSKEYRIIKYSLDPSWEPPHRLVACNFPVGPYDGNWEYGYRIFPSDSQPEAQRMNALSKPLSQSQIDAFHAYVDNFEADFCGSIF